MAAHTLSPRECQIASLILVGRTPIEIAQALCISLYTAKDHIKEIFRKTGTHSRPELTGCLTGHLWQKPPGVSPPPIRYGQPSGPGSLPRAGSGRRRGSTGSSPTR